MSSSARPAGPDPDVQNARNVDDADGFDEFARTIGPRLRRGLVAAYGVEVGTEAAAEAMRYAWEHRARMATMTNPLGYLFRVGQSTVRPLVRWHRRRVQLPAGEVAARPGPAAPTCSTCSPRCSG